MAGGFGALMLSSFPMLWNFGFLSVIAIIFSLIGALTVVPAFLMITERFGGAMHEVGSIPNTIYNSIANTFSPKH